MSELVSVLMPVLNEESSVEAAVNSVLEQVDVDVEVLVVDGHSVDRTRELVAPLVGSDDRVRLLSNEKVSIPSGLNVGLAQSRGQYVARVDGHSTITPDYLARAVSALRQNPQMAGIGGKRLGVSSSSVGRAIALALSSRFGVGNSIYHYADTAQLTDHASFGVYRRDVAEAVGGWDEALPVNEDVDFDHRICRLGHVIGFDPEMQVSWQVRDSVPALFSQYRRYGRGKAAMVRKNGRGALRARHAAPPAAVVGGAALLLLGLHRPRLLALFSPYLLAVAVASVEAWRRRSAQPTAPAALPAAFVAMHVGWGLGFLEGFVIGRTPALASGSSATRVPSPADADGSAPATTLPG